MTRFRIYLSRNDWLAGNAAKEAESLAGAKQVASAFAANHISASDGRTWFGVNGRWRRA